MKIFLFLLFFQFNLESRLVESLKAQIGEEVITQIDLYNFKLQLKQKLLPSSILLETLYKPSELLRSKKLRLQFLIEKSLLNQVAQQKNIYMEESLLTKKINSFKGALSNKSFSQKLRRGALSFESFRKDLNAFSKIELLLNQAVLSKIAISNQDIESYHFKKYKKALYKNFEYEFISLSFSETKKALVLKSLSQKEFTDLKALAQSFKLEYKSSRLREDQISPIFKKELTKLSVSQISSVLFFENTYYLLQLSWKTPLTSPKEIKIKNQIEEILFRQKLKKELREWIEEQKKQVFIKTAFP
ncbi:MAG: hypothetical protein OXC37_00600 [Bdellovibrionaceae bacterium]|nr:hypothetical protein [Pseudobdellovibrionaceae bacterium]